MAGCCFLCYNGHRGWGVANVALGSRKADLEARASMCLWSQSPASEAVRKEQLAASGGCDLREMFTT